MIKLRGGLVVDAGPALRAVRGNRRAAVVSVDEALRIGGIDPQPMVVAVRHAQHVERLATIIRAVHARIQNVDGVCRLRVRENVRIIPSALPEAMIVGQ